MPENRLDDYLDGLDAEWHAGPDMPIAALVCDRRMDSAAAEQWRTAWRRGLVGDVEMAWYTAIVRKHPASWLGWLHQYL